MGFRFSPLFSLLCSPLVCALWVILNISLLLLLRLFVVVLLLLYMLSPFRGVTIKCNRIHFAFTYDCLVRADVTAAFTRKNIAHSPRGGSVYFCAAFPFFFFSLFQLKCAIYHLFFVLLRFFLFCLLRDCQPRCDCREYVQQIRPRV